MTSAERQAEASAGGTDERTVVRIKKYANRRLYNTASSSYVTLDDLARMVKERTEFVVHDAKTGEDITRSVLTQIIVEEESKGGQNLLPIGFLRQLIGFYGDNLQSLVPRYLEASMQMFARNQEQFRDSMQATLGGFFPFGHQLEELSKQNMALFQNALQQMWAPFAQQAREAQAAAPSATAKPVDDAPAIDELKRQMEAMQRRLDELAKK
ncbi:MAG: polyhydroxyalkanoate synthesis repressor PhaR [Alphaproteobacteria bacterium]|nr:polyhydroxyalkanoate synthesis repressor PhaR [Alphaproteobacteria bacterium]